MHGTTKCYYSGHNVIYSIEIHRALTKIPVPTESASANLMIDWNKFGQHLGFKGKSLSKRRSEIFTEWLKRNPKATYKKLVSDLSAIGDHEGAQSVCRNYGMLAIQLRYTWYMYL